MICWKLATFPLFFLDDSKHVKWILWIGNKWNCRNHDIFNWPWNYPWVNIFIFSEVQDENDQDQYLLHPLHLKAPLPSSECVWRFGWRGIFRETELPHIVRVTRWASRRGEGEMSGDFHCARHSPCLLPRRKTLDEQGFPHFVFPLPGFSTDRSLKQQNAKMELCGSETQVYWCKSIWGGILGV